MTITGLTGSYTPNLDALPIAWSPSSAATSGQWTQQDGQLVFSLPFESNEKNRKIWAIQFDLVNPRSEHTEKQPTVGAEYDHAKSYSSIQITPVALIRDTRKFSQLGHVCNSSYSG